MLKKLLEERVKQTKEVVDLKSQEIMSNATQELMKRNFELNSIPVGSIIPNEMMLTDANKKVNLHDALEGKKTIIVFYRGSWCPYCNLQLKEYSNLLKSSEKPVYMLAISPETPDISVDKLNPTALPFKVLSDQNNELTKKMKLTFKLPDDLVKVYSSFGIDLNKSQKNEDNTLPIASTYIVDKNGKVLKAWLNVDYTLRAEPQEVIDTYNSID